MSMTVEEALEVFNSGCNDIYKVQVATHTAIKALEEIQQYRAIGTVEGYERAIQISIENYNLYREYKAKVQEFEAIGTVSEFRELKEKQIPKKPTDICEAGLDVYKFGKCPVCGEGCNDGMKYCDRCGTAFDWSEGKE